MEIADFLFSFFKELFEIIDFLWLEVHFDYTDYHRAKKRILRKGRVLPSIFLQPLIENGLVEKFSQDSVTLAIEGQVISSIRSSETKLEINVAELKSNEPGCYWIRVQEPSGSSIRKVIIL